MDGAKAALPIRYHQCMRQALMSRRAWGLLCSLRREPGMKHALVQILVVVANIQMRTLKTEVEKGSM